MYIDIGGDMAVRDKNIVGVFDLDAVSVSGKTMDYLRKTEKEGALISVSEDIPKSFLVTKEYGMEKVYFTHLSAQTIERRASEKG